MFLDGSTVKFRLNTTGPAGAGTDGDWPLESRERHQRAVEELELQLPGLGRGVPAGRARDSAPGSAFSWSNTYFSDVNGDGLVDFVTGGTVHFNTLDADGIPTFSTSSADHADPARPVAAARA